MELQAVIFDLDGVITDTSGFHRIAWEKLAHKHGRTFDDSMGEAFKGVSRIDCARLLFPEMTDFEQINALAEEKNEEYRKMLQSLTPCDLFEGVREFLALLKNNKIKTAIGSASKNAVNVLERLDALTLFDTVVDGTVVKRSKPEPDVFALCAERLQVNPESCVVIEDALAGVQAAHSAGMAAIGIGSPDVLSMAEMVVSSIRYVKLADVKACISYKADLGEVT
ncbi:MAG: beta-phosphoglucomutase [Acetanaerobacterium sp.]